MRIIGKSVLLLTFSVVLCCVIYPLALWGVSQLFFPFQANGSLLKGPDGTIVGSKWIAQPFTLPEYFHPRPSAAGYDASASASSSLAASNYALRDRVARKLGPIARYRGGPKAGQLVGPDIVKWFHRNLFRGQPNIVAQWAKQHPALAQAWLKIKNHSEEEIQSTFFDLWRQDHPFVALESVPGDFVTTSASGLDPHITLQNARFQLDRVVQRWSSHLNRDPSEIHREIQEILQNNASAPLGGLVGEKFVNVLEVNLELRNRFGPPS